MVRRALLRFALGLACGQCVTMSVAGPGDGLAGTAHDFATVGTRRAGAKAPDVCGACHVPRSGSGARMLWDPTMDRESDGTRSARHADDTYNGPSLRCLSCHDGTVANGDAGGYRESHPVPMPYPYGSIPNAYNGARNKLLSASEWVADPTSRNIRLYSEDGHGHVIGRPRTGTSGIECSSCHDAHNKAARDRRFLRASVGGDATSGYLCAQCHARG